MEKLLELIADMMDDIALIAGADRDTIAVTLNRSNRLRAIANEINVLISLSRSRGLPSLITWSRVWG
jgi:hypothetical protein